MKKIILILLLAFIAFTSLFSQEVKSGFHGYADIISSTNNITNKYNLTLVFTGGLYKDGVYIADSIQVGDIVWFDYGIYIVDTINVAVSLVLDIVVWDSTGTRPKPGLADRVIVSRPTLNKNLLLNMRQSVGGSGIAANEFVGILNHTVESIDENVSGGIDSLYILNDTLHARTILDSTYSVSLEPYITDIAASNYWTLNGSNIYFNSGSVGMGVSTVEADLHLDLDSIFIDNFYSAGEESRIHWRSQTTDEFAAIGIYSNDAGGISKMRFYTSELDGSYQYKLGLELSNGDAIFYPVIEMQNGAYSSRATTGANSYFNTSKAAYSIADLGMVATSGGAGVSGIRFGQIQAGANNFARSGIFAEYNSAYGSNMVFQVGRRGDIAYTSNDALRFMEVTETSATSGVSRISFPAASEVVILGGLKDKDSQLGSSGQVLSSTGTGTDWINAGAMPVNNPFGGTNTLDAFADSTFANSSSGDGGDGNGVYDGSGTIPTTTDAQVTDDFAFTDGTNDLLKITASSGHTGIGKGSSVSPDYSINVNETFTGAKTGSFGGLQISPVWTGGATASGGMLGISSAPAVTGTGQLAYFYGSSYNPNYGSSATLANLQGVRARPSHSGSGGVTSMAALYGQVRETGSGTVTIGYGLNIDNNSGTFTNAYGVNVNDQTATTAVYGVSTGISSGTGKYNIYSHGTAPNYFAGDIGIYDPSPDYSLDVTGTFGVSGVVTFEGYGTGTKEVADLSKTNSGYIATFATDGTLLEEGFTNPYGGESSVAGILDSLYDNLNGIPSVEDHLVAPNASGVLSQRVGGTNDFYSATLDQESAVSTWEAFNFKQGDQAVFRIGSLDPDVATSRSGVELYGSGFLQLHGKDTTGLRKAATSVWPGRIYQSAYNSDAMASMDTVGRNSAYIPGITRYVRNQSGANLGDSTVMFLNITVENGGPDNYFDYLWKETDGDVRYRWGVMINTTTEYDVLNQSPPVFEIGLDSNYIKAKGLANTIDSSSAVTPLNFLYTNADGKLLPGGLEAIATNFKINALVANTTFESTADKLIFHDNSASGPKAVTIQNVFGGGVQSSSPAEASTTNLDFVTSMKKIWQIDMTSITSGFTLTFSNPTDGAEYRLHFQNVTGTDSVTFPANVYFYDGTSVGSESITAGVGYDLYYDGTNYYVTILN